MDQFGPALQHLPTISSKGFEVQYPLDDPLMSEQLNFFKAATMIPDPQKLKQHILSIRDECCKAFPFPCILCFYFLQGMIVRHPFYPTVREVIEQQSDAQKILVDIGAGLGTDLRQIISHGWNRDDVLGVDITKDWDSLGYKLFRDSERPIPNFLGDILSTDVLSPSIPIEALSGVIDLRSLKSLNPLKGRVNFLILNQVFHLFDESQQYTLAERCALLLSDEAGSTIFGMQMGGYRKGFESKVFVHSTEVILEEALAFNLWSEQGQGNGGVDFEITADKCTDDFESIRALLSAADQSKLKSHRVFTSALVGNLETPFLNLSHLYLSIHW
ncbi:hypothetical protein PCANC_21576 [Puccinia coronata f. sp. avenae]|uniref:Methyltransferase domain-containing protein n=1 Tax=Puccinia coronata f. sp. avenae TaxID=200324 RepID=A0A2N5U8Z5_9BASI|nr:hypothetical protein PCANC_21576 [Puccinia coronata f. sp. avenae]